MVVEEFIPIIRVDVQDLEEQTSLRKLKSI